MGDRSKAGGARLNRRTEGAVARAVIKKGVLKPCAHREGCSEEHNQQGDEPCAQQSSLQLSSASPLERR